MSEVEEAVWVTDEISMAAFVALKVGLDPEFEWDGDACQFVFPKTSALMNSVVEFVGGDALVEPGEYHRKATSIRKNMFKNRARGSR